MTHTLGEILANALRDVPQETKKPILSENNVHVFLNDEGKKEKISAVKQLRYYTQIHLKHAKECVENPHGFYMPSFLYHQMKGDSGCLFTVERPVDVYASRIYC